MMFKIIKLKKLTIVNILMHQRITNNNNNNTNNRVNN